MLTDSNEGSLETSMKTRLFVFILLAVTLLGFGSSVPQVLLPAQETDSITSIPAPANESSKAAAEKSAPDKSERSAEVGQAGLTLGWKQLRELFLGFSSVPMWTLVGCSVLTVMLVIERLTALQSRRVMPRAFVTRFLQRLREGAPRRRQSARTD